MADVKALTEKLEQGVKAVWNSETYRKYLSTMSKFHHYSYNNVMLITLQYPDASLVAGYKAWQTNFKRNVRKGEKGIHILAPISRSKKVIGDDGEEKEVKWLNYKVTTVFDIKQTEGEDLPNLGVNELQGTVKNFDETMQKLQALASVPVNFKQIDDGAKGYCSMTEIAIQQNMSELQTVKTMIHELAHNMLGHIESHDERDIKEIQAESIAFVVAGAMGLDTSDYSFTYVAGWAQGRSETELKGVLNSVQKTADTIIKKIA